MERHNNFTEAQRCNLHGQDSSCPPCSGRLSPLQDEAPFTALSTPWPSTGQGPLHGPLHCPLQDEVLFKALSVALYWTRPSAHSPETRRLALPRTRPYQHNSSKA